MAVDSLARTLLCQNSLLTGKNTGNLRFRTRRSRDKSLSESALGDKGNIHAESEQGSIRQLTGNERIPSYKMLAVFSKDYGLVIVDLVQSEVYKRIRDVRSP
jgi:hypothetical protein